MRSLGSLAAILILSVSATRPTPAATVDWAHGCLPHIASAEQHYRLPGGLLYAVALTESGQDGTPYPWALNIGGRPVIPPSYATAAAQLRYADGEPRQDVAVGCMQIHMQYHLGNFGEPEWALHPNYNVWYAAAYLDQLHRRYGNWISAIAHYHGSDPAACERYLCRVEQHLREAGRTLGTAACGKPPIPVQRSHPGATTARANRSAIMAHRAVGRIIVLGSIGDR